MSDKNKRDFQISICYRQTKQVQLFVEQYDMQKNEIIFDKCRSKIFLQVLFGRMHWRLRQWTQLQLGEIDSMSIKRKKPHAYFSSFGWLYNTRFEIWVELVYYFTSLKIICLILLITSDESGLVSTIRKSIRVLGLVNKVQLVCSTVPALDGDLPPPDRMELQKSKCSNKSKQML